MNDIIIITILSFLSSVIFHLLSKKVFRKLNVFVLINERSSHYGKPTSSGGIALFLAIFTTTLYFYFSTTTQLYDYSILLPLSLLFIIGFYDDLEDADFKFKFLIQLIAAKLIIDQGFVIDLFYLFDGRVSINYFIAQLFTGFIIVAIINSINFIDGLDGLAISFVLFILGSITLLTNNNPLFYFNLMIIIALIPGLYFNYKNQKKVFLGDSGSLLLGGIIAINILSLLEPSVKISYGLDPNKFLLSGLLMFYPAMDLIRLFSRRTLKGGSPFIADKSHLHHILNGLIQSHFNSVLLIILICLINLFTGLLIWYNFGEYYLLFYILLSYSLSIIFIRSKA